MKNKESKPTQEKLWELQFINAIYFACLFIMIALYMLRVQFSIIQNAFVFLLLTLEYVLACLVWKNFKKTKITKSLFQKSLYLLYTIVGLPLTIYLAQFYTHSSFALFRYTLVITFLFILHIHNPKNVILHIFFTIFGLLFYTFFQKHDIFYYSGYQRQLVTIVYFMSISFFIHQAYLFYRQHHNNAYIFYLNYKRTTKKYTSLLNLFEDLLKDIASPKSIHEISLSKSSSKENQIKYGLYFVAKICFSDFNISLQELLEQKNKQENTDANAIRISEMFYHEWNLLNNFIDKTLIPFPLIRSIQDDAILIALSIDSSLYNLNTNDKKLIQLSENQLKQFFSIYFAIVKIAQFTCQSRDAFEQRNAKGWYMNSFLSIGTMWVIPRSLKNPSVVFRGPLIKEIEAIQKSIFEYNNISQKREYQVESDHIWFAPRLKPLYTPFFDIHTAPKLRESIAPEFLLSEFTNERSKLEPNAKFWASLELQKSISLE